MLSRQTILFLLLAKLLGSTRVLILLVLLRIQRIGTEDVY